MGVEAILIGAQMIQRLSGIRQEYKTQQRMYQAQAEAAQQNAAIMSRQREQQAEAYAQKQRQLNDRFRLARGQARAEAGASGLNADGSVADLLESSEDAYKQDSMNLLQNQRNDTWSTYVKEVNYRNQANAYGTAARNARKQGHLKLAGTLIGDAANVFTKGSENGWFGSGNGSTGQSSWAGGNLDFNPYQASINDLDVDYDWNINKARKQKNTGYILKGPGINLGI